MKEGFERLPNLDQAHNELHRKVFALPFLTEIRTTIPTTENIKEGELIGYYSGATYRIYTKINSTLKYWALT